MPYKVNKNETAGGTKYDIVKVPIFQLGRFREFEYDSEWGQRMLSKMQQRAGSGYYPPVILGHDGVEGWGKEKPAVGFMKNFAIEPGYNPDGSDSIVYCDLCEIGEEIMGQIRDLKYPYRSIEVWPGSAEISAVALLGASEPFFKFPRLEVENFSREDKDKPVSYCMGEFGLINPNAGEADAEGLPEGTRTLLGALVSAVKEVFRGHQKPFITVDDDAVKHNTQEKEEDDMSRDEFKAKYGKFPEELEQENARFKKENEELKKQQEEFKKTARAEKISAFCKFCDDHNVIPAKRDKFKAEIEAQEDPTSLINVLTETITEGGAAFQLPGNDTTVHSEKKTYTTDRDAINARVEKYAAEHNMTYVDALPIVAAQIDAEREGK